jgi:hypothetical protein
MVTTEPTAGHRHIRIGLANPTVRTRSKEVVACSVADPHTFEENIAAEKAKHAKLEPGPQMDGLLKKIRQLETASHMSEWLSSKGLQPST